DDATLTALQALAHDTAYIGHSASLTRCWFVVDPTVELQQAKAPRRSVYNGRFDELRAAYERFEKSADKKDRPQEGMRVPPEPAASVERTNLFDGGGHWLILEHVEGD